MTLAISADRCADAIDLFPDTTQILSLDCFDTLLWRSTHAPIDVFHTLEYQGASQHLRRWAESCARLRRQIADGRNEVSIESIYDMMLPGASDETIAAGVKGELDAEVAHCFAFAPTADLMRRAKAAGKRIIIVSDTYLNEAQLRALIADTAGDDVAALIDRIFCSSVYGVSKTEGLFRHVLKELKVKAQDIFHLGDNLSADSEAPSALGITGCHLVQFTDGTAQRLRFEANAHRMLGGNADAPAYQLHRAALAVGGPALTNEAEQLGFAALGPVFLAFEKWLAAEQDDLRSAHGGRVHRLYLMRDGYLPMLMAREMSAVDGTAVEISRFTAMASSFCDRAAIEAFLYREYKDNSVEWLGGQLLLTPAEIAALATGKDAKERKASFAKRLLWPKHIDRIIARSTAFADRLVAHIAAAAEIAPGDTLMLIDLGYNGTVQNAIASLLEKRLKVYLAGRYLLLREQEMSGLDKRGFLEIGLWDSWTLDALISNVAVVEQLATMAQGSVVDYAADGTPQRLDIKIKGAQSKTRDDIQRGCLAFAAAEREAAASQPATCNLIHWQQTAAAVLGRFMFMPFAHETAIMEQFDHDVNLGTEATLRLFDEKRANLELRRSGLFYLKGSKRMFVPAELRGHGLALNNMLFSIRRFGQDIKLSDLDHNTETLPVFISDGQQLVEDEIVATATHDGYYTANVPVGCSQYAVGLRFGEAYDWIELAACDFVPIAMLGKGEQAESQRIDAELVLDDIDAAAETLFHCKTNAGFMLVTPPPRCSEQMVLQIVYRPIVRRAKPGHSLTLHKEIAA